ncbi:MAG: DNA internalization-related competence protein ComEC/Rec2 [Pseudobutyrivibrio sp.]|nr:DNA internalization-related competence protein ComEC/Rec2 [Pseudobutyrivibrio sp.]
MLQGRKLFKISLMCVILIALSAYGPWDFLGVYNKAEAAQSFLETGQKVTAFGTVIQKEIKSDYYLYSVDDATVYTNTGKLHKTSFIFKTDSNSIPINSKLNISGLVKHFSKARNDGAFDMEKYYFSKGLFFELENAEIKACKKSDIGVCEFLQAVRTEIIAIYEQYLTGEEAGFLSSVVMGERGGLENELKELFQRVGVAHVLAVSGLHVSVICMFVYRFFRRRRLGYVTSGILSGALAIIYGIITGGSVSSIRAIGMFILFLVAQMLGECYDMLTAMAIMALALLVPNPLYITNSSFIFSFGAVLVIWFIALPMADRYKRIYGNENKFLEKAISGLVFSAGIFVGMVPVTTMFFNQIPIYSILLNMIILPLMPLLLGLGLIAGIVGLIFPVLAEYLLLACHYIIYFYEWLSSLVSKLPGDATIVGHRSVFAIVVYYLVLLVVLYFLKNLSSAFEGKECGGKSIRRKGILLGISVILCVAIFIMPRKGEFEIDFLDVGQGDGIYINSGDGVRFFIDGGSSSNQDVGVYTILPFLKYKGANAIDYWFISHTDNDHISGMVELLEDGYNIKNIVFTKYIPEDDNLAKIKELAKEQGTNILYMNLNDRIGSKHLRFRCVYPMKGAGDSQDCEVDVNDYCLALVMEYDSNLDKKVDYKAFFGGDLSMEQEAAIVESKLVGKVDLLKVNHHGSRFSSDSGFLAALSPENAVISCAKKNMYGHPSPEAVTRIEDANIKIFYTMDCGRIQVTPDHIEGFIWSY